MSWNIPDAVRQAVSAPAPSTFTPWTSPGPNSDVAAGYYDPSLLSSLTNAQTGLTRLTGLNPNTPGWTAQNPYGGDTGTQIQRLQEMLGLNVGDINRQAGYAQADAQTAMQRGTQDHDSALSDLSRNYNILKGQQLQTANAAGVLRGGAQEQAAQKRAANQAHDQQPIDTAFSRGQEDAQTAAGRAQANAQAAIQQAQTQTRYGVADLQGAATNAVQDFQTFGRQTQDEIGYQATANNWLSPAARPTNEFTNPQGQTYQIRTVGNESVAYLPNGQELWRRPRTGA